MSQDFISNSLKAWLTRYLRVDEIFQCLEGLSNGLAVIVANTESLKSAQGEIMATLQDVFTALEQTTATIVATVSNEKLEIIAAIRAAEQNPASADFDAIVERVGKFGSTITDAVTALVPTADSPVEPTPPNQPADPLVTTTLDLPTVEVPVEISETEPGIGVDGGASIEPG